MRIRKIIGAALLTLWPALAGAATVYVSGTSTSCNPGTPGSGTIGDPYVSLNYALTHAGAISCGDTVELRGGTYRNALGAFTSDTPPENACDDDNVDDAGNDGTHTILPLFKACLVGTPLIIENFAGEDVVIDGTDTAVDSATWTACESTTQCGAVTTGINLAASASTYYTQSLNVGSSRTPQLWIDPANGGDPGTRLAWDNEPACATTGCTLPAGTFLSANNGNTLIARLANGTSPATHTVKMTCQNGNCAWAPVSADGASYITLRKNAAGGSFRIKYGYYTVYVWNGANNITLDGVEVIGSGGRDYGQAIRTYNGSNVTVKNCTVREVMAEGIAFYGGGPNTDGIQISNNTVDTCTVYDTGRGWVDGGGNGQDLGMGVILKNCQNCIVRDSTIHTNFRSGVQVNVSVQCGGIGCVGDGALIERNQMWDTCHSGNLSAYPPTQDYQADCGAVTVRDTESGTVNNATIRNNMIYGRYANPLTGNPAGGVQIDATNGSITGTIVVNNSFSGIGGSCIADTAGAASSLTLRNNAMGSCSALGSGCNGQVCDLYINSGIPLPTTSNNTYWSANSGDQVIKINGGSTYTRATATSFEASAVQSDPAFTSSTDLHIGSASPMKDAGTATNAPTDDIDKQTRSTVDIGADEFIPAGGGGGNKKRGLVRVGPRAVCEEEGLWPFCTNP